MIDPPVLTLRHATVVKGGRPVLHGLQLTIRHGEHTAIIGPNGAGKSVLVGLLTHYERAVVPDDGDDAGAGVRRRAAGTSPRCARSSAWCRRRSTSSS